MKFDIERNVFADAVAWAVKTLQSKPTNPVLAGLLLQVGQEHVTLSCSDREVSSRASLEATIGEPGEVVVPGRLLADIARSLPPRPVTITSEGSRLLVRCGETQFLLPTLPTAEYPSLPEAPPTVGTVPGHVLADAVSQVAVAANREDSLPMMTGIHMELGPDTLTLAATDRFRLAVRELPWQASSRDTDASVLVRARTLVDLTRPLATAEKVEIALGDQGKLFGVSAPHRRSTTSVLDGVFADYRQLLAKTRQSRTEARVSSAALIDALKRVKLVVDGSRVRVALEFADGVLSLMAGNSAEARASDLLPCQMEGDPIRIVFNPDYLLDGLAALPAGSDALIAMQHPKMAVVISAADTKDYRYLLMPIDPNS